MGRGLLFGTIYIYNEKVKKYFLLAFILFILTTVPVLALTPEEQKIEEIKVYEAKVTLLQNQAQTLSGQVEVYYGQITLAQLKISQTEDMIASVSARINRLEKELQDRSVLLEKQIIQSYKKGKINSLQILFGSKGATNLVDNFKYLQIVQSQNSKFLYYSQKTQNNYIQQKTLIEESQKKLQAQKVVLNNLRVERNNLLQQTKNSEANYQKLLAQAKTELESLRSFAKERGGGILPPQPSPDGWYFNQRDERWGRQCIGSTCGKNSEYVWEVGCLITDIAMVKKKNGQNITPANIAQDTSYFVPGTAYMLHSTLASQGFTVYGGNQLNLINSELNKGKVVIVHLTVHTSDGHYVVLKSKNGSDYVMNDPWEGPDLSFSKYYSVGNINQVIVYN